jgi:hypothetical protein
VLSHLRIQILELRLTIGMIAVSVQTVAELAQELGDDIRADVVAHILQGN